MKFLKGVVVGGLLTAGVAMMYTDSMEKNKRMIYKKGKKMMRKMGVL